MRLLNVETIRLENWKPGAEYAILSHRWDEGKEVLFAEISAPDNDSLRDRAAKPLSWAKIEAACQQAGRDRIGYIWIDTCCIDKRSSAEESEEINSMYRYYQEAKICYAYLARLPHQKDPSFDAAFKGHEWFKRGWTLQEASYPAEPPRRSRYGGNGRAGRGHGRLVRTPHHQQKRP